MGSSVKPKYYAKVRDQGGWHTISWKGRATDALAEKARQVYNKSFDLGGSNYRISELAGYIIHVSKLQVIRNDGSGLVVAEATAPMFEVI